MTDSIDELLAQRASQADPAQAASAPQADHIDYLLSARAQGANVATPAKAKVPDPLQSGGALGDIRQWVADHHLGGPVQDFYKSAGRNVMRPLHGITNLIEHGIAGGINMVAPDSAAAKYARDVAAHDSAVEQAREAGYQRDVPDSGASYAGAAVGNILPLAAGAGERLAQMGDYAATKLLPKAAPSVLKKIASGSVQGGALAAAEPVGEGSGSYGAKKIKQVGAGLALGGVIPGAGAGLRAIGRAAKTITDPVGYLAGNYVTNILGDKAPQVVQNIRNAPQFVPGSMPTTAQIGGVPELVQAEKALSNQLPEFKAAMMARQNANNEARLDAVRGVAGTPDAIDSAVAARRQAAQPQIDSLLENGNAVDAQPILEKLQSIRDGALGVKPTIGGAAKHLQDEIAARAQDGKVSPAILDAFRQNVRDILRKYAPDGVVSSKEEAAFGPVKDQITEAIDRANPGYRGYLARYAQMSQPITDMEAASGILDVLGTRGLNSSGAPQLTLPGYSAQLKKAMGGSYPLSPEAEGTLRNVQRDLQRETVSSSVKMPGSDTGYNLNADGWLQRSVYGKDFKGGGVVPKAIGAAAGTFIPGIGTLGGWLGTDVLAKKVGGRIAKAAEELMLHPERMASELEKLQRTNPKEANALRLYLTQAGALQTGQTVGK